MSMNCMAYTYYIMLMMIMIMIMIMINFWLIQSLIKPNHYNIIASYSVILQNQSNLVLNNSTSGACTTDLCQQTLPVIEHLL